MSREITKTITVCCADGAVPLILPFEATEITAELMSCLGNRLEKKGIGLEWSEETANPELYIRVVAMNPGNQLLRYLIPFVSPAVLEVEGHVAIGGARPQVFHHLQKAHVGIFGGSAKGMLKACAQGVAAKIAADVFRSQKS